MKMSKSERDQLQREFSILSSLQHENIVTYYHRDHIKAAQELHIYMEYCGGGDLSRKIRDLATARQHAPEEYVWDVLAQINSALYRCHYGEDPPPVGTNVLAPPHSPKKLRSKTQVTILHRDLKPENSNPPVPFLTMHLTNYYQSFLATMTRLSLGTLVSLKPLHHMI